MPRDAASTRDALIAAGLDLFADQGVYTTPLARIVAAAGQRNTSALHYHFASGGLDARHGLLFAIIDAQNESIEAERRVMLDTVEADAATADLRRLVWAYVQPQANRLASIEGRRFLSIVSQLIDLFDRWDEDPERTPAEAMDSPAQMLPWARHAVASALRARASKPPAKPRAQPARRASKAARKPA